MFPVMIRSAVGSNICCFFAKLATLWKKKQRPESKFQNNKCGLRDVSCELFIFVSMYAKQHPFNNYFRSDTKFKTEIGSIFEQKKSHEERYSVYFSE